MFKFQTCISSVPSLFDKSYEIVHEFEMKSTNCLLKIIMKGEESTLMEKCYTISDGTVFA